MTKLTSNGLKWVLPPETDKHIVDGLISKVSNLHPVIAGILIKRGLDSFETIKNFFKVDLSRIDNYGEMKDCEKASDRVLQAIDKDEKILIYGDYDVDGTSSVSMLVLFLKSFGADVSYYIPDRYKEGYGVSNRGVEHTLSEKYDLMITVDCGISAAPELNRLSDAGIDVIICDHHLPGDVLPEVFAILNPQQADCPYMGKELCGCGVALILLKSLSRKLNKPNEWKNYLDLAAIATCCDIVPLRGVNRIIVQAGIEQINTQRRTSISALLKIAGYEESLDVSDIVFKIGPRINAAGRLKHASLTVELLIESDFDLASETAAKMENLNVKRKGMDKDITASALAQMYLNDPGLVRNTTVVHSEEWHKGVIGIVASRLIERCHRPTIVFTNVDGMLTGSGRSVDGVHLYEALKICEDHIEKFGGHAAAAGLSLKLDSLPDFMQAFDAAIAKQVPKRTNPKLYIDAVVDLSDWHNDMFDRFYGQLNRCRPFGPANAQPLFATFSCRARSVRTVGKDHLKFEVYQDSNSKVGVQVIAFNMVDHYDDLASGKVFKLAYNIEENTWRGKSSLQLNAKDILIV